MCLPGSRCEYVSRQWVECVEFTGVPGAEQRIAGVLRRFTRMTGNGLMAAWEVAAAAGDAFEV
jgi:hypothetical protein